MHKHIFLKNNHGIAAVEFALILPVLLLVLLGVLEFGVYFTKSSVVSRAVSNISAAIQMSPTATNLQTDAQNSGFGLVSFTGNNFFCAKAYSDRSAAGSYCIAGEWFTSTPAGHQAGTPYYVAIVASVQNTPISGITSFLPDMVVRNIITVGGNSTSQPTGIYKANSNQTWAIPAGVTKMKATIVGGGGGGSGDGTRRGGGSAIVIQNYAQFNAYGARAGGRGGIAFQDHSFAFANFSGIGIAGNAGSFAVFSSGGVSGGAGGDTPLGWGMGAIPEHAGSGNTASGWGSGGQGSSYKDSGDSAEPTAGNPGTVVFEW
jgi:Flp pilus assembly protein TadG